MVIFVFIFWISPLFLIPTIANESFIIYFSFIIWTHTNISCPHVFDRNMLQRQPTIMWVGAFLSVIHVACCESHLTSRIQSPTTVLERLQRLKSDRAMDTPAKDDPVRPGFHRLEIQKTTWDVPERYAALKSVGSGAYGTVWWEKKQSIQIRAVILHLKSECIYVSLLIAHWCSKSFHENSF